MAAALRRADRHVGSDARVRRVEHLPFTTAGKAGSARSRNVMLVPALATVAQVRWQLAKNGVLPAVAAPGVFRDRIPLCCGWDAPSWQRSHWTTGVSRSTWEIAVRTAPSGVQLKSTPSAPSSQAASIASSRLRVLRVAARALP